MKACPHLTGDLNGVDCLSLPGSFALDSGSPTVTPSGRPAFPNTAGAVESKYVRTVDVDLELVNRPAVGNAFADAPCE